MWNEKDRAARLSCLGNRRSVSSEEERIRIFNFYGKEPRLIKVFVVLETQEISDLCVDSSSRSCPLSENSLLVQEGQGQFFWCMVLLSREKESQGSLNGEGKEGGSMVKQEAGRKGARKREVLKNQAMKAHEEISIHPSRSIVHL